MKKATCIVLLIALGFFGGWQANESWREDLSRPSEEATGTAPQRRPARHVEKAAGKSVWEAFAERISRMNAEERQGAISGISGNDHAAALDAMLASYAFSDSMGGSAFDLILSKWAENFESAWDWGSGIANREVRDRVRSSLLDQLARTDLDRAFRMFADVYAEEPETEVFSWNLMRAKMMKSAADYLEASRALPTESRFRQMSGSEFAEDFAFKEAADGLARIQAEGFRPGVELVDFFEKWASRDALEAGVWLVANPDSADAVSGSWKKVFQAVEERVGSEEAVAWLNRFAEENGILSQRIADDFLSGWKKDYGTARLRALFPDTGQRDALVMEYVKNRSLDSCLDAITALSSPEVRLVALRGMDAKSGQATVEALKDSTFRSWGLDRGQVIEALGD